MRHSSEIAVVLAWLACTTTITVAQSTPSPKRPAANRPTTNPAAEQEKSRRLQALLAQWEQQSAGLRSLDVRFTREDISPAWDGKDGPTQYRGRAQLQNPDRALLQFEKIERDKGHIRYIPHEDIICTGKHVLQYTYPTRQIFVYPLPKEARARILEEGPLPFLFNMRVRELEARFQLKLGRETPDVYLIEVHPRLDYDKETFIGAHLALEKRTFLPKKLRFYAPNGKDYKEYTFDAIHTNPELDPSLFKGKRIKGWTIVENPGPDPDQARTSSRPARPSPR